MGEMEARTVVMLFLLFLWRCIVVHIKIGVLVLLQKLDALVLLSFEILVLFRMKLRRGRIILILINVLLLAVIRRPIQIIVNFLTTVITSCVVIASSFFAILWTIKVIVDCSIVVLFWAIKIIIFTFSSGEFISVQIVILLGCSSFIVSVCMISTSTFTVAVGFFFSDTLFYNWDGDLLLQFLVFNFSQIKVSKYDVGNLLLTFIFVYK